MTYHGRCHCGAVRFEVDAPAHLELDRCNCSVCRRGDFLHLIRPRASFRLLAGDDALAVYRFGTGVAEHMFCARCGVKPFYVPRSNPDGIDVNARCLRPLPESVTVTPFDGVNWEQSAHLLAHKSTQQVTSHE